MQSSKSTSQNVPNPRPMELSCPCPISDLTYDLLWYIISFLLFHHDDTTDFQSSEVYWQDKSRDHELSLEHMRRISQVCRYWRDLALESPSFWAQAINIQRFNQKSDNWRREVIKRSGNAPLSVRGTVRKAGEPSTDLLFFLLNDHWTRIRVLHLIIYDDQVVQDPRWKVLCTPSSILETFRVGVYPSDFSIEQGNLFANHAPCLRFLDCDAPTFSPSALTPWSGNLRTLIISTFNLEVPQILEALSALPLLETLQIRWKAFRGRSWDVIGHDWPVVKPSSLQTLSLKTSYKHVGALLHQIILPPTCRLLVDITERPSNYIPSKEELRILRSSLTSQFSNIVGPTRLFWTSSPNAWELAADTNSSRSTDPDFRVKFPIDSDLNFGSVIDAMSLAFAMSDLASNITKLVISLSQIDKDPSDDLLALIRSLSSVETISTETDTLALLIPVLDSAPGSFPLLKTIILQSARSYHLKPDVVMRFLMRRRDAGVAISVFDLRECRSAGQEKLLFLEGLDGLSVLWDAKIRNMIDKAYRDWTSVDSDE